MLIKVLDQFIYKYSDICTRIYSLKYLLCLFTKNLNLRLERERVRKRKQNRHGRNCPVKYDLSFFFFFYIYLCNIHDCAFFPPQPYCKHLVEIYFVRLPIMKREKNNLLNLVTLYQMTRDYKTMCKSMQNVMGINGSFILCSLFVLIQ